MMQVMLGVDFLVAVATAGVLLLRADARNRPRAVRVRAHERRLR